MKPETGRYLAKARRLLSNAKVMLGVGLNEDAGREAYLAAFHAAQALIFESTGKVTKSHKGVHVEFGRLTLDPGAMDSRLRGFLSRGFNLKSVADYEIGPDARVSAERARDAIETAGLFVVKLEELISSLANRP